METHTPTKTAEFPKSESYLRHRRQRFWQIITPVGFGFIVILVVLVLVIMTTLNKGAGGPVSQWADTSMIWLSVPTLFFALLLAVILIGMIYALAKLLKVLPGFTFDVQQYASLAARVIKSFADKLVSPIISVKGVGATVSAFFGALLGHREE